MIESIILENKNVIVKIGGYKTSHRGASSAIVYTSEDYIDMLLKEHWLKFNHVVHMIKHGRSKRIRNKYINRYEKERKFIIKIIEEVNKYYI